MSAVVPQDCHAPGEVGVVAFGECTYLPKDGVDSSTVAIMYDGYVWCLGYWHGVCFGREVY